MSHTKLPDDADGPRDHVCAEADLLPLSGLQHLVFCERQCALIHIEQQWKENTLTAEGKLLHERVDAGGRETRKDRRITRGVPVRSLRLGLIGKVDVLEWCMVRPETENGANALRLPGRNGLWRPILVEYKRGEPKLVDCDRVQVCAQALCLEEMLHVSIASGSLFYGARRRRFDVEFDSRLRAITEKAARRFHELVTEGRTPPAVREPKCRNCSLLDVCLPPRRRRPRSVLTYLQTSLGTDNENDS